MQQNGEDLQGLCQGKSKNSSVLKTAKKERRPFMRSLASIAGAAVIVYSVCSFVATQADIAEKKKKLSQLEEKAAQLEAENDETKIAFGRFI